MKRAVVAVWGAVGLLGLLLGGCSGSSSNRSDGGGGGPGTAGGGGRGTGGGPGTACNDYVAKYCARAQACEPGALTLAGFTSPADCASYFLPYCNDAFAAPHTGETVALLQQCGDGIAALSCTDFLQKGVVVPACRPQGGTIANGGSCNNDWQCASGSCWDLYVDSCGTCAEVTSVGQPCQVDADFGAVCPHDSFVRVDADQPHHAGLLAARSDWRRLRADRGLPGQRLLRSDHQRLHAASRARTGLRRYGDLRLRSDPGGIRLRRHVLAGLGGA